MPLWATMIVWWMGVEQRRGLRLRTRGLAALSVCVAVELSQRYHTPVLDTLRRTLPGNLVLGSGYDPRDSPHVPRWGSSSPWWWPS